MQSLVEAKFIMEGRDSYLLQYILCKSGMLSTTGYKVLQGQGEAGLIPCYRVVYDVADKLDYDVEAYEDLASMLPIVSSNEFLHYVNGILSVILKLRDIAFLHPCNLETTLDRVFIDRNDNSVHLVYLPIADEYLDFMNKQYDQVLKAGLLKALHEHENLRSDTAKQLFDLLNNPTATLEQVRGSLQGLAPLPQAAAVSTPTGTIAMNQTGDLRTSGSLGSSEDLALPVSEADLPQHPQPEPAAAKPTKAKKEKKKAVKKPFFGGKPQQAPPPAEDFGGTEVLTLFIPTIALKGQGKEEYLVNRQEFILGRDKEADCPIESTAISRKHCKISHSDERNFLIDLGSSNGTYLNGAKLEPNKPRPITEGDKIKLGNKGFTVISV